MKISIEDLLKENLSSVPFQCHVLWEDFPVRDEDLHFEDNIVVEGNVQREGKGRVRAKGEIIAKQVGTCDRCLEEAQALLVIPFDEVFVQTETGDVNQIDEELDCYLFTKDTLDLTAMVQDAIILNLPSRLLCQSDCKGLCPVCGVNRNLTQCSCHVWSEEEFETGPRTQRPFEGLLSALERDDEEE